MIRTARAILLILLAVGASMGTVGACRKGDGGRTRPPAVRSAHPSVFTGMPSRPVVSTLQAQMAYEPGSGLFFARFTWTGERGHLDGYWVFEDGVWIARGTPARDALQAGDLVQAEARLSLAWNDPGAASGLPNFGLLGCALACHDSGTAMPSWTETGTAAPQTMRPPSTFYYSGKGLDVWTWRAHTSSPNGRWIDELLADPMGGDGLRADNPANGVTPNALVNDEPAFVFDPATTAGGGFATAESALSTSPDYFFEDPAAAAAIAGLTTPKTLDMAAAALAGYVPAEGDTVPRWILSAPGNDADDILAVITPDGGATVAAVSDWDAATGTWRVHTTRAMATGSVRDAAFATGGIYELTFARHADQTAGRDHHVSLPFVVWFEDPLNPGAGAGADLVVHQLPGLGDLPDFDDENAFPPVPVDLFLPGVMSWEYLTDTRTAAYSFGEVHGGAGSLVSALAGPAFIGCADCHVVRADDPQMGAACGGPLEWRTPRRGGLFEATPASLRFSAQAALDARCTPCHAHGGTAARIPFSGAGADEVFRQLVAPGRVDWQQPALSRLLRLPSEDTDGNHPPAGALAGFGGSSDQLRILYWLLFDAPNN
ncbi:MAG TPA: ethylbenzene dehydrogenase-related protein [Planctomycetota bacterium]